MDTQLQSSFPKVAKRQLCHVNEEGGFVPGHVTAVFDGGFVVHREDGQVIRVLESNWEDNDAGRFLWLTRRGKPIKRPWWKR
ncbi:hypothetical protein [Alicyclobacillus sp. SO9]|uniref:hypothetical protein n=1 Tax=Alicyclobacillus sp. SO9 TaxID=2665646 RepID=UPI0018E7953F|nr:hypothetical protein [Alicyclobacillus sp. SO9]QQE80923.1 hypothetical protein GI364_11360 [Alicyclobacillus sp. SO9]